MPSNLEQLKLFDKKFVMANLQKFSRCPKCRTTYSCIYFKQNMPGVDRNHRPFLLQCGHNLCEKCICSEYQNLVCNVCNRPVELVKLTPRKMGKQAWEQGGEARPPKPMEQPFRIRDHFDMNFYLLGRANHLLYLRNDRDNLLSNPLMSSPTEGIQQPERQSCDCHNDAVLGECHGNQCTLMSQLGSRPPQAAQRLPRLPVDPGMEHHQELCSVHCRVKDSYCPKCCVICCLWCATVNHTEHGWCSLFSENERCQQDIAPVLQIIANATKSAAGAQKPSLIEKYGYPVEEHVVQTSDGYILTMHRIPYSAKTGFDGTRRPVAFLMHGLLCSSSDWVLGGVENGLAFILSDAGYDVWMGNARGNTYSKNHATKVTWLSPFWTFSWHEIAIYDMPAMMDYVLYWTGEENLRYFGHSQGTTVYFILNSMIPRFKSRIRSAHLLAPVGFMDHMESPLAKIAGPLLGQPNAFVELFGSMEFMPNTKAMELLGAVACRDESLIQAVCTNVLFLIAGYNSPFMNETMIPEIMATTPAGCSINQITHYLQEYNSGYFRQWDYGYIRNKIEYGSGSPPNYDVEKIEVPTYMYYSQNDYLAHEIDVNRIILAMNPDYMKRAYKLPYPLWNHLDFLWGLDVKEHLYDIVLEDVNNS